MTTRIQWIGILTICCFAIGCESKAPTAAPPAGTTTTATEGHSHDGWWCDEHGVPEEVCTRCNPKLAAAFKEKGDWCKEHDLPDSQCFICHPEHEAFHAALYEAKYGKQPPKPGEGHGHDHDHDHGDHDHDEKDHDHEHEADAKT